MLHRSVKSKLKPQPRQCLKFQCCEETVHLLLEAQGFFSWKRMQVFIFRIEEVMKVLRLMVFCLEGIYFTSVLYKQHLYYSYIITENFWPEVSMLSSLSPFWTKEVRHCNRIPWVATNLNCITFYFDDTLYYFSCLFTFLVGQLPLKDNLELWRMM